MQFGSKTHPCTATYSGPNVRFGQVIVEDNEMLYQAIESNGKLSAGRANITLEEMDGERLVMRLEWTWLTGDLSSGVSIWRESHSK